MNPFDFVNDINIGKKDIMRGTANDELAESEHVQYLTNKSLSYFVDTVFYANEMNTHEVDNRLHFTYLLNAVRPKKRFSPWAKPDNDESINDISKYYNISISKARTVRKLFTDKQIELIRKSFYKGGSDV